MNKILEKNSKFINFKDENVYVNFTTGEENFNLKTGNNKFSQNMNYIKNKFNLEDIIYLNQIHSDIVLDALKISKLEDGDGLVLDKENIAVGVFTADCVPIIMYDKKRKIIAAVHSGWKGTFDEISIKALNLMKEKGADISSIKVIIGYHVCEECYQVSDDLIKKFKEKNIYSNSEISKGRYLSLEKCILIQLQNSGIKKENIKSLNMCTYCTKSVRLHSYRKDKENSGRLFSFIYMK